MFVLIRQFLAIFSLFWTEGAGTGAGVVGGGGGGGGGREEGIYSRHQKRPKQKTT